MTRSPWKLFLLLSAGWSIAGAQLPSAGDDAALRHARAILRASPLIDGHNDLPWSIREHATAPGDVAAYDLRSPVNGQTDLAKLGAGLLGGQFWSVFIPGDLPDHRFARVQLEQIDIARQIIDRYPEALAPAFSAEDAERAFSKGRVASFLGMEGGHAIENSLGALRAYYGLGVRYMTLTHNSTLDWADAALDSARHNGLTPFGKEVVREMNRLGMIVDLSHTTPRVMSDALDVSDAPVIFSHSSARALTDHRRNVPDSILARMPRNGGVVMVTFVPEFVSSEVAAWDDAVEKEFGCMGKSSARDSLRRAWVVMHPRPKATIAQVADHVEYVRKMAGVDHVGIGGDFEGSSEMPAGLTDVSCYPSLFAELIRRGWPDADVKKVAGLNILRVLRDAALVARRLQAERGPSTATIEILDRNIR